MHASLVFESYSNLAYLICLYAYTLICIFFEDQNDEECNCKPGQKGSRVSYDITKMT